MNTDPLKNIRFCEEKNLIAAVPGGKKKLTKKYIYKKQAAQQLYFYFLCSTFHIHCTHHLYCKSCIPWFQVVPGNFSPKCMMCITAVWLSLNEPGIISASLHIVLCTDYDKNVSPIRRVTHSAMILFVDFFRYPLNFGEKICNSTH